MVKGSCGGYSLGGYDALSKRLLAVFSFCLSSPLCLAAGQDNPQKYTATGDPGISGYNNMHDNNKTVFATTHGKSTTKQKRTRKFRIPVRATWVG